MLLLLLSCICFSVVFYIFLIVFLLIIFSLSLSCRPSAVGNSSKVLSHFRFMGTFVAKALLDSRLIDLPLSIPFLKVALLGQSLTVDDMRYIDSDFDQSFQKLYHLVNKKRAILHSQQTEGEKVKGKERREEKESSERREEKGKRRPAHRRGEDGRKKGQDLQRARVLTMFFCCCSALPSTR